MRRMFLPDSKAGKFIPPSVLRLLAGISLSLCLVLPAEAQRAGDSVVVSEVDPPRTETSGRYGKAAESARVTSDAIYADELSGPLSGETPIRRTFGQGREFSTPVLDGGLGVAVAVMAILAFLFLWLKFGGGSVLFTSGLREIERDRTPPEKWNVAEQETNMDGQSLLLHLESLKDRREALARLLRHCLLSVGEDCDTRFARADTEREAFARLPRDFEHREALKNLLHDAELAHYGGRQVSEEKFARDLQLGRLLLLKQGTPQHAR